MHTSSTSGAAADNSARATHLRNSFFITGLLILFQSLIYHSLFAATANEITIQASTRSLVAPTATRYQWFYNHEPVKDGQQQSLKVNESGYYSVEISDDCGTVVRHHAMIVVKGNAIRKIYLIGDSTVANYTAGYYPQTGWGQVLKYFFNSANVTIDNRAVGGTSSKSFYNTYWAGIRSGLQAGDYVFIQFGINDSNSDTARRTLPFTTFTDYLTKYVNEARAKGAIPVLVSTLNRNAWNATTPPTIYPAYHDYPVATRQLAQSSLNVPLIDLDRKCTAFLESVGPTYATNYLYMNLAAGEYPNYSGGRADNVHFQEMGALEMAKLVVQGVRDLSSDSRVNPLIPFVLPTYSVTVSSNNSAAGLITRTNTYPAGVTVTVKAFPNSGYRLARWTDGANVQVSTAAKFSFVMGTTARTYKAVYESAGTSTGIVSGATYTITARHSGQVADVAAKSLDNGASITQYPSQGSTNQRWIVTSTGDGYYTMKAVHSGKNMDVTAKSTADGASIAQYTPGTGTNQQFQLVEVGGGYYNAKARHSGKCVEVAGSSTANGAPLQQWTCGSGTNQQFRFDRVSAVRFDVGSHPVSTVRVSPNPSADAFLIRATGDFSYFITNALGKPLESGKGNEQHFAGARLGAGFYLITVQHDNQTQTFKVIKE